MTFSGFYSTMNLDRVQRVWDLNLHIDDTTCNIAAEFLHLQSFDFMQHLFGSTHTGGHALNLIFIHGIDIELDALFMLKDLFILDHECIFFIYICICFKLESEPPIHMRHIHFINDTAAVNFSMMCESDIILKDGNVEILVLSFNNHCSLVVDKVVPSSSDKSRLHVCLYVIFKQQYCLPKNCKFVNSL